MDPPCRARLDQGETSNCELGDERVDPEPATSLQPLQEQVRVLELGQQRHRIGAIEHVRRRARR